MDAIKNAAHADGSAAPVHAPDANAIAGMTEDTEARLARLAWLDEEPANEPSTTRGSGMVKLIASMMALGLAGAAMLQVPAARDAGRAMLGLAPADDAPVARTARTLVQVPDVKLVVATEQINAAAGQPIGLPVSIDNLAGLPKNSFVLVRGVPDRATLSIGTPFGEGTWKLMPEALPQLAMTMFAMPAASQRLEVELLSGHGEVIARAAAILAAAAMPAIRATTSSAQPREAATADRVSFPPLKAEAASAKAERVAKAERAAAAKAGKQQASERNVVPRPALAVNKQAAAAPQPKSKTGWKMNWDTVSYAR